MAWVPNYSSAIESTAILLPRLMEKMPIEELHQRYYDNSAIAALAVIVEDESRLARKA